MQRLKPPFVSDYAIRALKFEISRDGIIQPVWKTKDPEAVNTLDIADRLREPNTFLWGWTEIHHQLEPTQVRDQVIDYNREYVIRKEHVVNNSLVMLLSDLYSRPDADLRRVHKIRSYEQILFDLGWMFEWRPTGEDDLPGAVIPEHIIKCLEQEPEIRMLMEFDPDKSSLFTVASTPHPAPPDAFVAPATSENEYPLSRLELKIDTLVNAVTKLVELNASSHLVGSGQPGPYPAQREEAHFS